MPLPAEFLSAIRSIVGGAFTRDAPDVRLAYGTDALRKGTPADLVVLPGSAGEIAAIAALCTTHRVPLVVRGAGTGIHRRRRAPARGRRAVARAPRSHHRNRRREPARRGRAECRDRTPAGRGRAPRTLLPAGPGEPPRVGHRRKRRGRRRRSACVQVRHDQAVRARARGRAADRRGRQDRIEDGQERGRLRPDATARRLRGHARDHHSTSS